MQPPNRDGSFVVHATALTLEDESFLDALDQWMRRTPWLACSIAAHAIVVFILMAIPWEVFEKTESPVIIASIEHPEAELFEEPPPEVLELTEEQEVEDPELQDAVVDDSTDFTETSEEPAGDPDFVNDVPTESWEDCLIGIGGGKTGNKYGNRFGGRRSRAGQPTIGSIERAQAWLARHQDQKGGWDVDGFSKHDTPGEGCSGAGDALHDVGLTGLCLLAFLGDGHTTTKGDYADNVARGIGFLKSQQDPDTGLIGNDIGHGYMYNHAIATLAICEAYYFSRSPLIKRTAQKAVNFITRARNPYGAWRYDARPNGDNDTSITGWMVFALKSAEEAGLKVDKDAFAGALSWIDEVSDRGSGRVGYTTVGSESSRITGVNEHFPRDKGEAMTAVGLLCRFLLGQDPDEQEIMKRHADLLLQKLPEWDPDSYGNDMYYWYYGSYAMFQMGGNRYWKPWNKAMKGAILKSQRTGGCADGSWDPIGPWGYSGGRVYSTACMVLCLEVTFRYARVLGAR